MTVLPLTPQERKDCRLFMGQSRLYASQANIFEGVLDAVNGLIADPKDQGQTVTEIRVVLANLNDVKVKLDSNRDLYTATCIEGEIQFDAIRNTVMWRFIDGPAYCQQLAILLNFQPTDPYFSPAKNGRLGRYRGQPLKGW